MRAYELRKMSQYTTKQCVYWDNIFVRRQVSKWTISGNTVNRLSGINIPFLSTHVTFANINDLKMEPCLPGRNHVMRTLAE